MSTIQTDGRDLAKALAANATVSSYAALADSATQPSGDGIFALNHLPGLPVPNNLLVVPYGVGVDNVTGSVRVVGWHCVNAAQWTPVVLAEYDSVMSAAVGLSGGQVLDTERYADTVTLVANMGTDGQDTTKKSPQNDTPAHFLCDLKGCRVYQIQCKKGTATSMNALHRAL